MQRKANRAALITIPAQDDVRHNDACRDTIRAAAGTPSSNVRVLRVWRRVPTKIHVEFLTEQGCHAGVIRDISHYGAGIVGSLDLARKDTVTIHFSDGRLIPALVRWQLGNRFGVSFLVPLSNNDPLLSDPASRP